MHRQEMLRDTKSHQYPPLKAPGRPLFWNRVFSNVFVESQSGFFSFDETDLTLLHTRHHNRIMTRLSLPPDLSMAFQNLRFLLDAAKVNLIQTLQVGLFPSPQFQQFCSRKPQDPRTSIIRAIYQPLLQNKAVKHILPFLNIFFDNKQLRLFGLHTVAHIIGCLMQSDSGVNAAIIPQVVK